MKTTKEEKEREEIEIERKVWSNVFYAKKNIQHQTTNKKKKEKREGI